MKSYRTTTNTLTCSTSARRAATAHVLELFQIKDTFVLDLLLYLHLTVPIQYNMRKKSMK